MSGDNQKHPYSYRLSNYLMHHKVSLSLLLAAYGAIFLSSVILGGWTMSDWGNDITFYPPSSVYHLLPRSFINPIFFTTSFPLLIIGTIGLCIYAIHGISPYTVNNKEHVAILLTAFGFAYQVIGAWPLGKLIDFPWDWQKQIIQSGLLISWSLYLLSLASLIIGGTSLYSRIYHQKYPELNVEKDKG
jgi:hypothetical protein